MNERQNSIYTLIALCTISVSSPCRAADTSNSAPATQQRSAQAPSAQSAPRTFGNSVAPASNATAAAGSNPASASAASAAIAPPKGPQAALQQASSLNALETKLFEHTYPADSTDRRVERIEKLVFGDTRSGSTEDRLKLLLGVVNLSSPANGTGSGVTASRARNVPSSNSVVTSSSDYPAVTLLENEILGSAHKEDPIRTRLDRLEQKVYGSPSGASDLSLRVNELKKYATEKGLTPPVAKFVAPPPKDAKLEDKVTWLEEQVFARSAPNANIHARVRRLNQTVLPNDYLQFDSTMIVENVNILMSAIQLDMADRLAAASDGRYVPPLSVRYHPTAAPLPPDPSSNGSSAKMNSTASILQDIGMPNPMKDMGVEPASLATSSPDDDKKKKKKKTGGFFAALKDAIQEGSNDRGPIPGFAYGQDGP